MRIIKTVTVELTLLEAAALARCRAQDHSDERPLGWVRSRVGARLAAAVTQNIQQRNAGPVTATSGFSDDHLTGQTYATDDRITGGGNER